MRRGTRDQADLVAGSLESSESEVPVPAKKGDGTFPGLKVRLQSLSITCQVKRALHGLLSGLVRRFAKHRSVSGTDWPL